MSCRLSNSKQNKKEEEEEGLEFSKSSLYDAEDDSSESGPKSKDDKYR